jgi:hypothetical protein
MQGAQVPLAVTYTLAVIAILGPIGGALLGAWLTARRDDKRWSREKKRDNERWAREREQRFHDERLAAYSEALLAVHRWEHELDVFAGYMWAPDQPRPDIKALPGLEVAARNGLVGVDVLGTETVAQELRDAIVNLQQLSYRLHMALEQAKATGDHHGYDVDTAPASNAVDALRNAIRAEAVQVRGTAVSPSPPSAPTS